jgi:hypothetical protein
MMGKKERIIFDVKVKDERYAQRDREDNEKEGTIVDM